MMVQATPKLRLISMPGVQTRLNEEEEQTLLRVLREADALATGPEAEAFEKEFAELAGAADAVAVNSCSSALEMAVVLSGIGPGDEVIVPSHTFVGSVVPFARSGATIRWADIDPDTRVISATSIESLINPKTKLILAVHLYGLPADMNEIMQLADQHDLIVVEDCAQSPGARYRDRRVGSIGNFGCFSFHAHKNITTLGEGGMLTVRIKEHAVQARKMRWMGNWPYDEPRDRYWVPSLGNIIQPLPGRWPVNYCMGEPNAAVGRLLLKRLDAINEQRSLQAARFQYELTDYPELVFQHVPEDRQHVHHLMVARYDGQPYGKSRDDLIGLLFDKYHLKCWVQYRPLHQTELFRGFGYGEAHVPQSDRFFANMISFPWWSDMDHTLDEIADRTRQALDELR